MGTTVPIDGGTLAYETAGAGPPIVFIAGLGGHGSYWKAQVEAFSPDFQTRDVRPSRRRLKHRSTAVQHRAMGRRHAAADGSSEIRAGASGRPFHRRRDCASDRGRPSGSDRVAGAWRHLGAAGREISPVVRVPQPACCARWVRDAYEDLGLTLTMPAGLPPDAATRQASPAHAARCRAGADRCAACL